MRQKWFRAKNYDWGWYPSTWQGWSVLLLYIAFVIFLFISIDSTSHSVSDTLINFIPNAVILSIVLIFICYITGEKPEWRWGDKKPKKR